MNCSPCEGQSSLPKRGAWHFCLLPQPSCLCRPTPPPTPSQDPWPRTASQSGRRCHLTQLQANLESPVMGGGGGGAVNPGFGGEGFVLPAETSDSRVSDPHVALGARRPQRTPCLKSERQSARCTGRAGSHQCSNIPAKGRKHDLQLLMETN